MGSESTIIEYTPDPKNIFGIKSLMQLFLTYPN